MSRVIRIIAHWEPEWRSHRRGRLTLSKLHIVMSGTIRAKNKLLRELGNEFFVEMRKGELPRRPGR